MIVLTELKKSFGAKHILRGVNLTVPKGESMVIIGGSGTGKSVTLKCILGLIKPDSGEILVDGRSVAESRDGFLDQFGMLFQGGALFDSLLVWENIAFRLRQGKGRLSKADA
ncbi:MAG: ATP-binding cassette domain-containing protein, partial [Pseudomonadota bacterium]